MTAIFALAALLAAGAAAEEPVKTAKKPAQELSAAVRHSAPKGWKKTEYANGADPVLRYVGDSDEIVLKLYGGPGSVFAKPGDFPAGPSTGKAKVAGREVDLMTRRFPLSPRDPHGPSSPAEPQGTETMLILELKGGRFAVLSRRRLSPAPDLKGTGDKAWEAFLKSVKLPSAK